MLHFPEVEGNTSKMSKVQYIVKHFSEQVRFDYVLEKELCVDECLIDFEGQASAIQYRSNKHHCFWSKFSRLRAILATQKFFSVLEGKNSIAS